MDWMNSLFLLCGALLFLSVVSTTLSARLGMPLLLVFLAVGMLVGEDGIGRVDFDNFVQANVISQLALAVILLDGGLRTRPESFRIALKPSAVLATWGVFATVLLLGLFTTFYLGSDWKFGILMAAIVGSTDAGAVFSLLRNSGVRLNEACRQHWKSNPAQRPDGGFSGYGADWPDYAAGAVGRIVVPVDAGAATRLRPAAGLARRQNTGQAGRPSESGGGAYALMIVSGGLLVFAFTNLIGGSGFLAVYLAGIIVGNQHSRATEHVLRVMDGLAWLAQATMFVVLGLLVTPTSVLEKGADALVIAVFLMLVARPAAVFGGLWKFHYSLREKAYISWLGLRGAVPISLAMMPLVMGVPNSKLLFDVAFAVVILSLLIQGTTIPVMARWLKVAVPPKPEPKDTRDIWLAERESVRLTAYRVAADSEAEGMHPDKVAPISSSFELRCFALIRGGGRIALHGDTALQAGDTAWYILPEEQVDNMARYFTETGSSVRMNFNFFGEFIVDPAGRAGDLAQAYGLRLNDGEESLSLYELFEMRADSKYPVEGDRIEIGGFMLIVKELDKNGTIKWLGLKCPQ